MVIRDEVGETVGTRSYRTLSGIIRELKLTLRWEPLGGFFLKDVIDITYICVSSVQHNDSIYVYIVKLSPQ